MYKTLKTSVKDGIGEIILNRPDKLNALSMELFGELKTAVEEMNNKDVVVVILRGEGRAFSAGLDFKDFLKTVQEFKGNDIKEFLYKQVLFMQESINSIEESNQIFIAAIHGFCVGGGLDIASTCDIRLSSKDAIFSIMETKVGVVPDLGSIQRLPRIIGEGNTRLLAYTSRKIPANEAFRIGLINEIYENKEELFRAAFELALEIKSNPKEAVKGTKEALRFGIKNSIDESFKFAARYNANLFDFEKVKQQFMKNIGKGDK